MTCGDDEKKMELHVASRSLASNPCLFSGVVGFPVTAMCQNASRPCCKLKLHHCSTFSLSLGSFSDLTIIPAVHTLVYAPLRPLSFEIWLYDFQHQESLHLTQRGPDESLRQRWRGSCSVCRPDDNSAMRPGSLCFISAYVMLLIYDELLKNYI